MITRLLGEGTQGHTLEAVDKQAGRLVAVKRFQVRGARTWKDVELAEREARVLEALSHPGLPAHVEHFEEEGALYLVMEKIEGESVTALRRRSGALGREEVARFLRDAAAILDYLHGRSPPIIHRDIKPGNVLRRPDGSFALVDFGAVRDRLRPEGGSTVVGTFGFMAPEQFQGRARPGSDVYAVGATAIAMLTGEEPEALPHRGLAIDVAAALKGRADPALVEVLTAMLEPDPDRRPERIAPLLARLGPVDTGERRREEPRRRASRPDEPRRHEPRPDEPRRRDERRRAPAPDGPDAWAEQAHLSGAPLFFATLGLLIARLSIFVALEVVTPFVLALLSLVFGRGLREAAGHVREAGQKLGARFDHGIQALRRQGTRKAPGRVRVGAEADPTTRARVEDPDEEAQREHEAEAEAEHKGRTTRRR